MVRRKPKPQSRKRSSAREIGEQADRILEDALQREREYQRLGMTSVTISRAEPIRRHRAGSSAAQLPGVPLFDMLVFAILVAAAFHYRRRADTHKRLMTLATIALLPAPIARLPLPILQGGLPVIFGLADLFLVACVVYDLIAWKHIHRATIWGGLIILVSQPLRLIISGTPAWVSFAAWLTR